MYSRGPSNRAPSGPPADRDGTNLTAYLAKVRHVAAEIAARHFYQRPGRWCGYCDFLPVCLGDQRKIEQTLTRVSPQS